MTQLKVFDVSACLVDGSSFSCGLFEDVSDAQDRARAMVSPSLEGFRKMFGIIRIRIQPRPIHPKRQLALTGQERTT